MKNGSEQVVEKFDTHFLIFNNFFFRKLCRLWDSVKNTVEWGRPQMTICRMRIACWTPKATNIHTGCVILIAFTVNNSCTNVHEYYVTRTLPVLFEVSYLVRLSEFANS